MSRVSFIIAALFLAGCSGPSHDLDLEDIQNDATAGSGSGSGTSTGSSTGTTTGTTTGTPTGSATGTTTGSTGSSGGPTSFDGVRSAVFIPRDCVTCHNATAQVQLGGNYNLDSFATASAGGRIVAGNENSVLITKCLGPPIHNGCTSADEATLIEWIVDNNAAP